MLPPPGHGRICVAQMCHRAFAMDNQHSHAVCPHLILSPRTTHLPECDRAPVRFPGKCKYSVPLVAVDQIHGSYRMI